MLEFYIYFIISTARPFNCSYFMLLNYTWWWNNFLLYADMVVCAVRLNAMTTINFIPVSTSFYCSDSRYNFNYVWSDVYILLLQWDLPELFKTWHIKDVSKVVSSTVKLVRVVNDSCSTIYLLRQNNHNWINLYSFVAEIHFWWEDLNFWLYFRFFDLTPNLWNYCLGPCQRHMAKLSISRSYG